MAFATQTLDIDELLIRMERKLTTLEIFAKNKCNNGAELPALVQRSAFRNDKAMFNAVESSILRIEKIAATIPKTANTGRSHIQAVVVDYDPGEQFDKEVGPFVEHLLGAARKIGALTKEFGNDAKTILEQTEALATSVKAEAILVSRAAKMPKPGNPTVMKRECQPLVDASSDTADYKYVVGVRSSLHDHAMALSDTAAALGWVIAPAPLKHVRDYKQIVHGLTESILARYIELGCNAAHSDFAEALNHLLNALVTYVEKEHPAGLRWNYAKGAVPLGYRRAKRRVDPDAHPIGDFFALMHGALTVFILRSREIGAPLSKAADGVLSCYFETLKVVESASNSVRPSIEGGGGELRMLLMSVQHELVPLVDMLKTVKKSHKYYDHCVAVQEFIGIMQWCTATLNKMSPVTYLIDIEAVTKKCLERVDKLHGRGATYKAELHRAWTRSVRDMMAQLKEYVKTHHPNEMMFDTRRSRRSFEEIHRRKSLTKQIETLKKKSSTRKWKLYQATKVVRGRRKDVPLWRRI